MRCVVHWVLISNLLIHTAADRGDQVSDKVQFASNGQLTGWHLPKHSHKHFQKKTHQHNKLHVTTTQESV